MKTQFTAIVCVVILLISTAVWAEAPHSFTNVVNFAVVNVKISEGDLQLSSKTNGFALGVEHYFSPISDSEYPVLERAFISRTSYLTLLSTNSKGDIADSGTNIADYKMQHNSFELLWHIAGSELFATLSLDNEKATLPSIAMQTPFIPRMLATLAKKRSLARSVSAATSIKRPRCYYS